MNSKQPELSIFQGVASIHVDNNQLRAEEEEAIQDQKRRQAEVNFLLLLFALLKKNSLENK
jgi:hypothetical protein